MCDGGVRLFGGVTGGKLQAGAESGSSGARASFIGTRDRSRSAGSPLTAPFTKFRTPTIPISCPTTVSPMICTLSAFLPCVFVWSSLSTGWASTGYGYQSCSSSAEQGKMEIPLSMFAPRSFVSRVRLVRSVPRQPAYSPHSY